MVKSQTMPPGRPNTATLMKPTLLDTKLLGIFDMSTVSTEHLIAIKNLVASSPCCRCAKPFQLKCADYSNKADTLPNPPTIAAVTVTNQQKIPKMYKVLNKTYRIRSNVRQRIPFATNEMVAQKPPPPPSVPSPCDTCGRQEQPERFHSHPSRVDVKQKETRRIQQHEERKTVQKPIPMKFRSAKSKSQIKEKENTVSKKACCKPPAEKADASTNNTASNSIVASTTSQVVIDNQTVVGKQDQHNGSNKKIKIPAKWREAIKKTVQHKKNGGLLTRVDTNTICGQQQKSPSRNNVKDDDDTASEGGYKLESWNPAPTSGGRKRNVVCYLCRQEFGTAALPSHEAQCIQQFRKQNIDQCDNETTKTIECTSESQEDWKLAWEITQASLVSCENCDRKFFPARLEAHQKVCQSKSNKEHSKTSKRRNITGIQHQPGVLCEHCGKRYGSSSIAIHREQCAKKCHVDLITKTPTKDSCSTTPRKLAPPTILCYICGRNFGTKSIAFHEPQCLKKWKQENDKLPTYLQKDSPIKPIEMQALEEFIDENVELFWKAHQAQLVPCSKCSRTFYPDRLEVHLKGCKGLTKNKSK